MFDSIWKNITAVTMAGNAATAAADDDFGIINNAAIGITDGKISFVGAEKDLPASSEYIHDGDGYVATPALIDCHSHLVYGGNRADEFEKRLQGASYAEIARAGGGILSTVRATRAASEETLFHAAQKRMSALFREGVAAFEIKSGYGLDLETERKMLRVATRLRDENGLPVQRTFLGAHALPPEYAGRAGDYIDHVCRDMLPALASENLVDAVDGFCENIAFTREQMRRVFDTAQKLDLPVKLHAEQLSNMGGATLAAEYGALSADHLEYIDDMGVKAMAAADMTAVLLPGAFYYLREKTAPPVDLFRKHRVPVAIATDHNPGTSPTLSLLLMMNMACTFWQMTPVEALAGVTKHAARALGCAKTRGSLETGKDAAFALWDISHPRDLAYAFGHNPCQGLVIGGNHYNFG